MIFLSRLASTTRNRSRIQKHNKDNRCEGDTNRVLTAFFRGVHPHDRLNPSWRYPQKLLLQRLSITLAPLWRWRYALTRHEAMHATRSTGERHGQCP